MPQAFSDGLAANGYKVTRSMREPQAGDVLLIWNRYGDYESLARRFEKVGGVVIVAENGYHGLDDKGKRKYALSLKQHHAGGAENRSVDFEVQNRQRGKHILVCAQRGIGSQLMASPNDWHSSIVAKLETMTKREVRVRKHPGKEPPAIPLSVDLTECHACFIWSSACGVEALLRGVPVVYAAPQWIGQESATHISQFTDVEKIPSPDPLAGLTRAFSNQWTLKQVQSGEAISAILKGVTQ